MKISDVSYMGRNIKLKSQDQLHQTDIRTSQSPQYHSLSNSYNYPRQLLTLGVKSSITDSLSPTTPNIHCQTRSTTCKYQSNERPSILPKRQGESLLLKQTQKENEYNRLLKILEAERHNLLSQQMFLQGQSQLLDQQNLLLLTQIQQHQAKLFHTSVQPQPTARFLSPSKYWQGNQTAASSIVDRTPNFNDSSFRLQY